jgi:hypothetical protein
MISPNYHFTFEGAAKTVRALEQFQPNLKKSLDRKIGKVLSVIVNQARAEIPFDIHPSGWAKATVNAGLVGPLQAGFSRGQFKIYDAAKAKAGIKKTTAKSKKDGKGFQSSYGVIQRDAAGAIFETAGRGSKASRSRTRASRSDNPIASQQFIQTLEKYYGVLPTAQQRGKDKGRALIKAVDANKSKAQGAIFEAIKEAEKKAQEQLDKPAKEGR